MQYKQNSLKRMFSAKVSSMKLAAGILVAIILPITFSAPAAFAAGSASFSFSTGGGTVVGNTFSLTVSINSSAGDNVNGVQANFTYPSNLLQETSYTLDGNFNPNGNGICGQHTISGGNAAFACADTSGTDSGTVSFVTVSFTVVGSGSGQVQMVVGSPSTAISSNGGTNVWNGTLTSASYSFSASTQSGGTTGGSSGGTTTKKTTPAPSSPSTTKASTSPATSPSKPATIPSTTTSPQTTTQQPSTTPVSTAALTITITDSNGKPVKGAKVIVDSQYSALTDASGKASISGLAVGNHKVSVTASGKTTTTTTLKLDANEDKQVALKLAAKQSLTPLIFVALGVLVLGGGAVALLKMRGGGGIHGSQFPVSGIVVGSGNIPSAPARPIAPVQPTAAQQTTPQVITSTQPPANPGTPDDTTPKVQ